MCFTFEMMQQSQQNPKLQTAKSFKSLKLQNSVFSRRLLRVVVLMWIWNDISVAHLLRITYSIILHNSRGFLQCAGAQTVAFSFRSSPSFESSHKPGAWCLLSICLNHQPLANVFSRPNQPLPPDLQTFRWFTFILSCVNINPLWLTKLFRTRS